ncbi:response regulator transcription factor [Tateyamaria omphalii]|uniref:response regulator transcription factor n=1 Tax=Tateyamaria omphalii TaxID=299262 RepID=UPI001C9A07FF|nr:response regulator transcription factor [Tateyamaria omphalii]MBY5935107.1 response regulator transcription factor [Tateyamaria omphalii]
MSPARILIVEDDPEISEMIADTLRRRGHIIDVTHSGAEFAQQLNGGDYALVILDRLLPDAEGAELCRSLRQAGDDILVFMITAQDALEDKLEGLEAGADDYLTKPFAFAEMAMRVETLLRRADRTTGTQEEELCIGPLRLDRGRKKVTVDGTPIALTATEFSLLAHLMQHTDRPVDRMELLNAVWGYDFDPETNVVEVYILYLRRKLSQATTDVALRNVRGFGYVLETTDSVLEEQST